jgi:hypothetical protein
MLGVIQYSGLVRRIKKSEARALALCRRPRMNVVVLLPKKEGTVMAQKWIKKPCEI